MIDKYHDFLNSKKYTEGTHTNSENFLCKQTITRPKEFIVIVGAAIMGIADSATSLLKKGRDILIGNPMEDYEGNPYMFINQGIRAVKMFDEKRNKEKDKVILIVFEAAYTDNDKKVIASSAKNFSADLVFVKNVSELISILNGRKQFCGYIEEIEIYSHGVPGSIEFHLDSSYDYNDNIWFRSSKKGGSLKKDSIDQLDKAIFSKQAKLTSYACRTGISVMGNDFSQSSDAKPEESLAQYIADKLRITVFAYEKRSSYENTYNNVDFMNRRERELNDRNDGGPIMPTGAVNPPTTGESPIGLKDGLQMYTPQK